MQDRKEIRSRDGYCHKCAEWTDTDQVVFFFFFAIIAHHLRSAAAAAAAVSRRSHLRSPAGAAALCALQIQNPPPHNAIHRFRHDRHQEQDQEDNKNKW
jgi:hypothetical protein